MSTMVDFKQQSRRQVKHLGENKTIWYFWTQDSSCLFDIFECTIFLAFLTLQAIAMEYDKLCAGREQDRPWEVSSVVDERWRRPGRGVRGQVHRDLAWHGSSYWRAPCRHRDADEVCARSCYFLMSSRILKYQFNIYLKPLFVGWGKTTLGRVSHKPPWR